MNDYVSKRLCIRSQVCSQLSTLWMNQVLYECVMKINIIIGCNICKSLVQSVFKKKKKLIFGVILRMIISSKILKMLEVSNVSEHAKCKYMVRFSISTDNQTVLLVNT